MHQSTLKLPFRMRCFQCNSFAAQSYSSSHRSILCHHCRVFIGTPVCKVCSSEDTVAHQPNSGRWRCETCDSTFTYRSVATKAEKRRCQKTRILLDQPLPSTKPRPAIPFQHMEGKSISVWSKSPEPVICDRENTSICVGNDKLQGLIDTVNRFAKNRNLNINIQEFQVKFDQVIDNYENKGTEKKCQMSPEDLASAAEEALFTCRIIELTQAIVNLSSGSEAITTILAMIMKSSSVRFALSSADVKLFHGIESALQKTNYTDEYEEENEALQCYQYMSDEINSDLSSSSNTEGLAGCHMTDATAQMEDSSSENNDPYDVEWKWYPQRTTALLPCGFSVRLLN